VALFNVNCNFLTGLFQDDKGRPSMTNVGYIAGLVTLIWLVIYMEIHNRTNLEIVLTMAGTAVGGLTIKKRYDNMVALAELNPEALNQPKQVFNAAPLVPVPVQQAPSVSINMPGSGQQSVDGSKIKVDNVDIQTEGDVNVSSRPTP